MILRIAITLLVVSSAATSTAEELNLLFLGNSFTARHDIAGLVEQVLEEGAPSTTVNVQRVIYGGQNMFKHSTYYFSQSYIEQNTLTQEVIKNRIAKMKRLLENDTPPNPEEWNVSWLERNDTVKGFGFDEHCLWQMYDQNGVKRSRYYKPHFRINGEIEEESITDRFGPDVLADFMIDFMKRKKDEPFLIYYPALLVHTPYIRVPGAQNANALPDSKQKNGPNCFPEMVEYLDKNVGRLVNAVDELGLKNNTIILFCADNGTHGPVKSIWGENRTKIRGGKMTMTDRGSRVPLIASWPGKIEPGTRCDDLVELADFLPTLLEIGSAPKPIQRIHGQSFLPQLLNKETPSKQWVHIEYKGDRQIRTRDWVYTDKGKLNRVNELGRPENRPESQFDYPDIREQMERIFASIDGVER